MGNHERGLAARCPRGDEAGGILVVTLIAVMAVSVLAASFLHMTSTIGRRQTHVADKNRAFYLAEAGLAEAWTGVQLGKSGIIGSEQEPAVFGDGLFWVAAVELEDDQVQLECTAMVGSGKAVLSLVCERGEPNIGSLGVFSAEPLVIEEGVLVDGYDGRKGPYTPPEAGEGEGESGGSSGGLSGSQLSDVGDGDLELRDNGDGSFSVRDEDGNEVASYRAGDADQPTEADAWDIVGTNGLPFSDGVLDDDDEAGVGDGGRCEIAQVLGRVASNGAITVESSATQETVLQAHVVSGPGMTISTVGDPQIDGVQSQALVDVVLPLVQLPDLTYVAGVTHAGPQVLVFPGGEAAVQFLTVQTGAEVKILGPAVLRLGSLSLADGARLVLDDRSGPIDLYVEGPTALSGGSEIVCEREDTRTIRVQVKGDHPVRFNATGAFYGTLFAPDAELELGEDFEVFGTLAARKLTIANDAKIHFDRNLARYSLRQSYPDLVSWRIVELPQQAKGIGSNPFLLLGVDRSTLKKPSESHANLDIRVMYVDHDGVSQSYVGREKDFDWSDVARPMMIDRTPSSATVPDGDGDDEPVVEERSGDRAKALGDALGG